MSTYSYVQIKGSGHTIITMPKWLSMAYWVILYLPYKGIHGQCSYILQLQHSSLMLLTNTTPHSPHPLPPSLLPT